MPPPPPPPPPDRWLRPRIRFMFMLMTSCFPIVGWPEERAGTVLEYPNASAWSATDHRRLAIAGDGSLSHWTTTPGGNRTRHPHHQCQRKPLTRYCQTVFSTGQAEKPDRSGDPRQIETK